MGSLLQIFLTDIMIFVAGLRRVCYVAWPSTLICYEKGRVWGNEDYVLI